MELTNESEKVNPEPSVKENLVSEQEEWNKKRTRCEIFSRVVGYIRPISQFNEGKVSEFNDRKVFDTQKF